MNTDNKKNDQHDASYQQATRSGRRLTATRQWLYRLALPLALGLIRLFWASYRVKKVLGDEHLDRALAATSVVIPVMWHQHLMIGVRYLLDKRVQGLKLGFMVSPSVDGEAGAMAAERVGGYVIRGSSTYTGARALRDFYLAVSKDQVSPLITPDGPRGPRYEFKSGALLISQLAGKPMLPIAFAASRVFKFRAWDRFILPLPFARVVIAVGEPIQTPRVVGPEEMQRLQIEMANTLKQLFARAHRELVTR
ncbi:MAG: lysophospholipid acyltransferase family protein [Candidatus Obscuribacterales bacterium]|nr:lysophospholipid acyltransferase family protein [Steroidobacteraceae bacterium]